jgi:hypothetical protein
MELLYDSITRVFIQVPWKLWDLEKEWIGHKIGCIFLHNFIRNIFWPCTYLGSNAYVRHRNSLSLPELLMFSSSFNQNWNILTNFSNISQSWSLENSFVYVNLRTRCANISKCFSKKCFVVNAPEVYLKQFFPPGPPGLLSITSCWTRVTS